MSNPKYLFGDIVVVDDDQIGIVVKTWLNPAKEEINYEVYVRSYNKIKDYNEVDIERYRVRHKCLTEEELEYQNN